MPGEEKSNGLDTVLYKNIPLSFFLIFLTVTNIVATRVTIAARRVP